MNVYVDGEDVRTRGGLDTPVRENATVILLPAMAGGVVASSLLDLIGNTPLVELQALSPPGRTIYVKLEGQNPTGSIKDRVALAMVDAADLQPGQELLEPTSGNTGISLALVAKLRGLKLTCVMPANATPERRRCSSSTARRSSTRPAKRARTAPCAWRRRSPPATTATSMLFQYANEANPRAHYEGTGGDRARPAAGRRARRRPRHRRHADGHGRAPARGVPRRADRRRRAAAGRAGDGAALARGRLRAADPRRVEARPQAPRLERRGGRRGARRCSSARASSPASPPARSSTSPGASQTSCPRARSSSPCSPTAAGSTSPATFWSGEEIDEAVLWW